MKGFGKVVEIYQKAAQQGSVKAQMALGKLYQFGYGVEINYETVFHWYKAAADQGSDIAQYKLGDLFENFYGPDLKQAVEWYKKSAEQGNKKACKKLAHIYAQGDGVEQDFDQSLFYFSKLTADESGAYHLLGLFCMQTIKDYSKAKEFLKKSHELGNKDILLACCLFEMDQSCIDLRKEWSQYNIFHGRVLDEVEFNQKFFELGKHFSRNKNKWDQLKNNFENRLETGG